MEKFLNTKIKVLSEEHSRAFQKAAFKVGCRCIGSLLYENVRYLFIDKNGLIRHSNDTTYFQESTRREITFNMETKINSLEDIKDLMVIEHVSGLKGIVVKDRILYEDGWNHLKICWEQKNQDCFHIKNIYEIKKLEFWNISSINTLLKDPNLVLVWTSKTEIKEKISEIEEKQRKLADELKELQNQL